MHASLNVGYQGKSGPGKIHEVILVDNRTKETHCFTRQGEIVSNILTENVGFHILRFL